MGDINKSPNLPTGIQTTDKLWVGRDAQGPYQISVGDLVNLVSESVEPSAQPDASAPLTAGSIVTALTGASELDQVKKLVGNDVAKPTAGRCFGTCPVCAA